MRLYLGVGVIAMASASCATRSGSAVPEHSGASSATASATQAADVTRALRSDPPLPSEAAAGWNGLTPASATDPHAHHHHGAASGSSQGAVDSGHGERTPEVHPAPSPPAHHH